MTTELSPAPALPARYAAAIEMRAKAMGGSGANLGEPAHRQIRAETDLDALTLWLGNYVDRPTTHANYRKEAERLLLWALADALEGPGAIAQDDLRAFRAFLAAPDRRHPIWTVIAELKPISSLTHADLTRYRGFLADPQPSAIWITEHGARYATHDPRWRPFARPLDPVSIKQAVLILDSLFGWLVEAGYLRGNLLGLLRQRRRRPAQHVTRFLPAVMWQHVKDYVAAMPDDGAVQQREKARARWLTTLFYLMGMRISEVAAGVMGNFVREIGAHGTRRWWLEVIGKGLKYRRILVSDELLEDLIRYRQAHGLASLPARHEAPPCCCRFAGGQARPPATASIARRCTTRSKPSSGMRRTGSRLEVAREAVRSGGRQAANTPTAPNTPSTRRTYARRPRTGCAIRPPRTCWTIRWTSGRCAITSATIRSTPPVNTRTKKTIAVTRKRPGTTE